MAWITRGRCRFYVRSVRRGRRVAHEYFAGAAAELAAALDADKRHRRKAARAAAAGRAASWRAAVEPLDRLAARTNLLVQAVLLAGGYRQHHQGEWRRRRDHERTT
jgi:hypothetical protein